MTLVRIPALRPTVDDLVPAYPLAVFVGGLALAWRFKHRRAVLMLVVLAVAERALTYWEADPFGRVVGGAIAFVLPIDLALFAWLPGRGRLGRWAGVALVVPAIQVAGVAVLALPALASLADWHVHAYLRAALVTFPLSFLAVLLRFVLSPTPAEAGSFWAVVVTLLAAGAARDALDATIYLATAGLILVVSLIEVSHAMAYGDELTGLPGRRALTEALAGLGESYTVAMVDLDRFKKFNDEHGHQVGDQLLRMVGATLGRVGGGGGAFRYGGEEFVVIFPGKTVDEALPHLEGLRRTIESSPFTLRASGRPKKKPEKLHVDGPPRRRVAVTVSIGVAEGERHDAPERIIKEADAALYRAKRAGRNRISA